jgi:Holliday junction resolvase RusA-like endonuclease
MLLYEIFGPPIPQKQTKFIRKTGIAYNPSKKDADTLIWQIKPYAPATPLTCAIEMHLFFYMPIPESTSKAKRTQMLNGVILPTKKPDFDNLAYLVTNALKKLVYYDDSQVTDCIIRKRYDDRPRTVIKIIPLEQLQPIGGPECA